MAQLRQDYDKYRDLGVEIIVVGPEGRLAFKDYWTRNDLPFTGLPDPEHQVLKLYGQEIKLFKLGRMPAMLLIDRTGRVRFVHYGHSMSDIPTNQEVFQAIQELGD